MVCCVNRTTTLRYAFRSETPYTTDYMIQTVVPTQYAYNKIYVLFINSFIRRNRNIILYFNMTHYWVMRIGSWVIHSNFVLDRSID